MIDDKRKINTGDLSIEPLTGWLNKDLYTHRDGTGVSIRYSGVELGLLTGDAYLPVSEYPEHTLDCNETYDAGKVREYVSPGYWKWVIREYDERDDQEYFTLLMPECS